MAASLPCGARGAPRPGAGRPRAGAGARSASSARAPCRYTASCAASGQTRQPQGRPCGSASGTPRLCKFSIFSTESCLRSAAAPFAGVSKRACWSMCCSALGDAAPRSARWAAASRARCRSRTACRPASPAPTAAPAAAAPRPASPTASARRPPAAGLRILRCAWPRQAARRARQPAHSHRHAMYQRSVMQTYKPTHEAPGWIQSAHARDAQPAALAGARRRAGRRASLTPASANSATSSAASKRGARRQDASTRTAPPRCAAAATWHVPGSTSRQSRPASFHLRALQGFL